MPLTITQLQFALDRDLEVQVRAIHSYLAESPGLAFTAQEVAEALDLKTAEVWHILEKLDDLEFVRSGRVDDEMYYIYLADLPPPV